MAEAHKCRSDGLTWTNSRLKDNAKSCKGSDQYASGKSALGYTALGKAGPKEAKSKPAPVTGMRMLRNTAVLANTFRPQKPRPKGGSPNGARGESRWQNCQRQPCLCSKAARLKTEQNNARRGPATHIFANKRLQLMGAWECARANPRRDTCTNPHQ